ncbi:MAG: hypothetical protein IPL46_33520 [Saprospiraceae bacterium]|nr:hypothetical protein [Saprospiraceae bacterium]
MYQAWMIFSGRSDYIPEAQQDMYKETLFPALVLTIIFSGALTAEFFFKSQRVALYFVLSPLVLFFIAFLGMMIVMPFIRNWR